MSTPTPGRAFTRAAVPEALVSLLTLTFLAVVIRTAWLSDDSLITLRTVLNVTHGFGLRFNIDERVQTFTHPLWLAVVTARMLRDVRTSSFAAFLSSVLLAVIAFWTAVNRAATAWQAAAVVVVLLFSRAFVDFSTSGLENPLSCVLLAWFVVNFLRTHEPEPQRPRRLITRLWLITSLLYLTRPDDIVLVAPMLAVATWRLRRSGVIRAPRSPARFPLRCGRSSRSSTTASRFPTRRMRSSRWASTAPSCTCRVCFYLIDSARSRSADVDDDRVPR